VFKSSAFVLPRRKRRRDTKSNPAKSTSIRNQRRVKRRKTRAKESHDQTHPKSNLLKKSEA
jgi:hypothetical protein